MLVVSRPASAWAVGPRSFAFGVTRMGPPPGSGRPGSGMRSVGAAGSVGLVVALRLHQPPDPVSTLTGIGLAEDTIGH